MKFRILVFVTLLTLVGCQLPAEKNTPTPTSIPQGSVTPQPTLALPATSTSAPTSSPLPISTSTPTATLETSRFYEPIMEYIDLQWPWFLDDFSTYKENPWGYPGKYDPEVNPEDQIISDGALRLSGLITTLRFPEGSSTSMRSVDFAVEYDLAFKQPVAPSDSYAGYQFRTTDDGSYYEFRFYPGDERWEAIKRHDRFSVIQEGQLKKDAFTLRIIAYGDWFAVIIDGELLTTFEDAEIKGKKSYFTLLADHDTQMIIDNLKYWNLDGVEFPTP